MVNEQLAVVTEVDLKLAIARLYGGELNQPGQFVEQGIALVAQIVGPLAGQLVAGDLAIVISQSHGNVIDLEDLGGDRLVEIGLLVQELAGRMVEGFGQDLGVLDQIGPELRADRIFAASWTLAENLARALDRPVPESSSNTLST